MVHMGSPLKAVNKSIASLGALLGLLAWFYPDLRNWFVHHGLIGWLAAIVMMIAGPVLMSAMIRNQMERRHLKKDCDLIVERLDGWTGDGPFYEYLCNQVANTRLPTKISDDIEKHCSKWEIDGRKIQNKELRLAFENTKNAAKAYDVGINDVMFTWEKGEPPNHQIDFDYLMLSPELKFTDPARFYKVDSDLHARRLDLVVALKKLFSDLHETMP